MKSFEPFNAEADAEVLHNAMKGLGKYSANFLNFKYLLNGRDSIRTDLVKTSRQSYYRGTSPVTQ